MASSLPTSSDYELDFFTAPTSVSPLSIEGTFDSLISATACLSQLKSQLGRWDGVSRHHCTLPSSVVVGCIDGGWQRSLKLRLTRPVCGRLLLGTPACPCSTGIDHGSRSRYPRSTTPLRFNIRLRSWYPHYFTTLGPAPDTRRPLVTPLITQFVRCSLVRPLRSRP